MHVSPFVSGIATGAVAGAVVSMVAAGAMMNPSVRRSAQHRQEGLLRFAKGFTEGETAS